MKSCVALLFALAVIVVAIGSTGADYARLNRYLTSKVDSDEVGSNLAAAASLLKSIRGRHLSHMPGVPATDLKDFTALQQVIEDNKCDGSVDDILRANEATIRPEHVYKKDGRHFRRESRRVDRVVTAIVSDYAVKCEKVRLGQYQARKARLDRRVTQQVDAIAKAIMEGERAGKDETEFYQPESLFDKFIRPYRAWLGSNNSKLALVSALATNAHDESDVKLLDKKADEIKGDEDARDAIKHLIEKYLFKPCRHYIVEMGSGLFVPARHSIRVFETVYNRNDLEYYMGWSKFRICEQVIGDKVIVFSHVLNLI